MLDLFIKIVFYVGAGLVLFGSVAWYSNAAYVELSGKGELVIAPLRIAESGDARDGSRAPRHRRSTRSAWTVRWMEARSAEHRPTRTGNRLHAAAWKFWPA